MTPCLVKVGDIVTLNNDGVMRCFGSSIGLSHLKTLQMKVTGTKYMSEWIHDVQVDNPEINQFMLCDLDFTVVKRA